MRFTLSILTALCLAGTVTAQEATPLSPVSVDQNDGIDVRITDSGVGQIEMYGSATISAPIETVWSLLMKCETQLHFVPGLKKCEMLQQGIDEEGRWDVRTQTFKYAFPFPKLRSEVLSRYDFQHAIEIETLNSDFGAMTALWTLAEDTMGKTRLQYKATLDPSLPVPRSLIRKSSQKDLPLLFERLRVQATTSTTPP
jgi:carbon monoxide dehydrogenase subunit G